MQVILKKRKYFNSSNSWLTITNECKKHFILLGFLQSHVLSYMYRVTVYLKQDSGWHGIPNFDFNYFWYITLHFEFFYFPFAISTRMTVEIFKLLENEYLWFSQVISFKSLVKSFMVSVYFLKNHRNRLCQGRWNFLLVTSY